MTPIIIRAVPDRAEYIAYLRKHLPMAVWCFDKTRNAMDTFLSAMEMAGEGAAVHMEEDILLSEDFADGLAAGIAGHPASVVQFFSMRSADETAGSRWDRNFCMNQCFYLPAGYSKFIAEYYPEWPKRQEHPTGYDILINDWLRTRREAYWLHVPSLVQHRVCRSVISPRRSSKRQSKTFRSALP